VIFVDKVLRYVSRFSLNETFVKRAVPTLRSDII
jgi:hypothetical protein